jgi:hypothetical protein
MRKYFEIKYNKYKEINFDSATEFGKIELLN